MKSTALFKMVNWGFRLLELIIAIILVGDTAYFIDQWNKYSDIVPPASLIITLIASVFGVTFALIYLFSVMLGGFFHSVAAAIDFVVFTLYLTSIGLLAENYKSADSERPLVKYIAGIREARGLNSKESLVKNMVSLLDGLVIVQIFLYFFSMLLSAWVAWKERKYTKEELRMARGEAHGGKEGRASVSAA